MTSILVVDDAAFIRMRIKNILATSGHVVNEAVDGVAALEAFKAHNPALVLMDVHMPNMDGLTALQEILKINKDARVIMLSNAAQQEHIMKALEFGAKNFVVKPFDEKNILNIIKKTLAIIP